MKNTKNNLEEFLNYTESQKDVSLVIAEDEKEIKKVEKILNKNNFEKIENIENAMDKCEKPYKGYLLIDVFNDNELKDSYDFLKQYSTGQIEIFDRKIMKINATTPNYEKSAIIFLTTKKNFSKIKEKGYNFMSYSGLTYQN